MITRTEINQLSAEAERAAVLERERRARLAYRGYRAAETGKRVALISLAGLLGVAIVERLTHGREPRATRAGTAPEPRQSLLARAGMLAVALMRWSSGISRAWLSLTAGRTRMADVPADASVTTDA